MHITDDAFLILKRYSNEEILLCLVSIVFQIVSYKHDSKINIRVHVTEINNKYEGALVLLKHLVILFLILLHYSE